MMKKHIILIIFCIANLYIMNGQNDYQSNWKKVEEFDRQGLPKSALEVIKTIYKQAKKEKNDNQTIKAFLHEAKYLLTLEENAQLTIISDLKNEIEQSAFPKKNILESILANLYWQYFQQNRWRFYNRTQTATKVDQQDFRTWDLETLFAEVHLHFQNSIKNGVLAQQTDLSKFDNILHTEKDSKKYRPTLYDFLIHNALDFYKTSETNITKPAYAFSINDAKYLKEHTAFSTLKIETKDSLSLQYNALKLYQNLIKFHIRNKTLDALTEANLERIKFVTSNAVFTDKNEVLLQCLQAEQKRIESQPSSALYSYEIASLYRNQSTTYDPSKNDTNRWKAKDALALCDAIIKKFPNSRGSDKCNALKSQILQATLNLKTEKHVPIQTPSRILVSYKNLGKLYLNAFKITPDQLQSLNRLYETQEKIRFINALQVYKTWDATLRNDNDYQGHTTEITLPALDRGFYLIVASVSKDLSNNKMFSFGDTQVSNLALIENKTPEKTIFQVLDRNNGTPIANATIHLTTDKQRRHGNNQLDKKLITDDKGQASLTVPNYLYNIDAQVTYKDDSALFKGYYLNQSYDPSGENKTRNTTFLFTDRSIYRPGQTVYFKGIMMSSNGVDQFKAAPNQSAVVTLRDANNQEIKVLNFTTNEYGSYSGEFILPSSGLTGNYTLQTNTYETTSISVEEYKRPKFETTFDPVTKTYKINDNITLKGTATAYSGSVISNAKVVYRVHRKVRYPRWCYWYPRHFSQPQEITHGETKTDDKGAYIIDFKAIPDLNVPKEDAPTFNYEVIADVTDINGETRSTTTIVNVGYHALIASVNTDSKIDKSKSNHTLTIDTRNLNNEPVAATGTIKIFKLKAPDKPLRTRPWKAPDYEGYKKEEFAKLFPHDAYKDEHDYRTWEKGAQVLDKPFSTSAAKDQTVGTQSLTLGTIKSWESGKYVIELTAKDRFGQDVKDIQYTSLYSQQDQTSSDNQLFEVSTNKDTYKIGEDAIIKFSSASDDITITVDIEKDYKTIETRLIKLSKNSKTIKIPVLKEDLGGFAINYSYGNYNDYQSGAIAIRVPYEPTALSIETKTFRDKLQPGQDETWSFSIKGPKGEKVSAELLASMYDASLDQFKPHDWYFDPINQPVYSLLSRRNANQSFGTASFRLQNQSTLSHYYNDPKFDQLNWFGLYFGQQYYGVRSKSRRSMRMEQPAPMMMKSEAAEGAALDDAEMEESVVANEVVTDTIGGSVSENKSQATQKPSLKGVKIRKNLQETAFFFPKLTTDKEGNVSFNFTAPEALTQWKLQLLAHTKSMNSTVTSLETVTQKELMASPNPPRFLREGDQIIISSKISNLTSKELNGTVTLQLVDAFTNNAIDSELQNTNAQQSFTVTAKGNTNVSWELKIPDNIQTVQYKIIAKAGSYSDGEQNVLPVLSNRMLVTETLPMWIRSNQTKTFTLDKLKNTTSSTLKHHKLTLEMTSNPAWYAVQALPYLMEPQYPSSEQVFSRYYANNLASHIANSTPRIKQVFDQWRSSDALLSNLEKNQELKSLIIQETPWLRDAQSETEQKKRIALLFDLNKMNTELQSSLQQLMQMQYNSGGFPWFSGGRENRFITQHIATGFGHLDKLGATRLEGDAKNMLQNAIRFLDTEFVKEYEDLKRYCKKNKIDINKNHLSYTQIHYLYMRSFFSSIKRPQNTNEAWKYYLGQAQKYWLKQGLYSQGMLALITHRNGDSTTASKILRSLDEKSITNEELGMYWKSNTASWYWYQAPIETQSLLIEAFSEIEKEPKRTEIVDNLKVWLLKNKQTNRWETTKATADAVYALLLQGSDWLSITDMVDITLGDQKIDPSSIDDVKVEAGTGYFKTSWSRSEIQHAMATAKITKKGKGIAWGALYWQYFEDLDKITSAETPLSLKKKLFLKKNTDTGEKITEINKDTPLALGDLIRVRIELRSDRAMEFVHMKDMRASGLEPINVLSQYKWQDGLGYYESTRDASTNFFFDYLPKGVYVFEYDLRVNNKGDFSNGITTIQCMYAPEFSSHSEGVRVLVK